MKSCKCGVNTCDGKCDQNRGASLVEYALLLSLIAIVTIPAVRRLGKNTRCSFVKMNVVYMQATSGLPIIIPNDCNAYAAGGPYG